MSEQTRIFLSVDTNDEPYCRTRCQCRWCDRAAREAQELADICVRMGLNPDGSMPRIAHV